AGAHHLEQALDGAVLTVGAVQQRQHHVHLAEPGGHLVGAHHQQVGGGVEGQRQPGAAGRGALHRGQLLGRADGQPRRVGGGEHPLAAPGDADRHHLVAVRVDRRQHTARGDAADLVLGTAPAEDDGDADFTLLGHAARPYLALKPTRKPRGAASGLAGAVPDPGPPRSPVLSRPRRGTGPRPGRRAPLRCAAGERPGTGRARPPARLMRAGASWSLRDRSRRGYHPAPRCPGPGAGQTPYRSGLALRDMNASSASAGDRSWCIIPTTASVIGMSIPCLRASARIDSEDFTPSAVCFVSATTCSRVSPEPSRSPKVRLRESGELHVATRSPIPASPARVCSSAPSATASRTVSARPRVISEALALSPKPMPTATPTASAMTFFTAPPSSAPTRSVLL